MTPGTFMSLASTSATAARARFLEMSRDGGPGPVIMAAMEPPPDRGNIVEYNADGTFTKETCKRAMKALKKRMKLTRLDDESKLGHDAMSQGGKSGVVAVKPPEQYPAEIWAALEEKGRVRVDRHGLCEILEQENNPSGS